MAQNQPGRGRDCFANQFDRPCSIVLKLTKLFKFCVWVNPIFLVGKFCVILLLYSAKALLCIHVQAWIRKIWYVKTRFQPIKEHEVCEVLHRLSSSLLSRMDALCSRTIHLKRRHAATYSKNRIKFMYIKLYSCILVFLGSRSPSSVVWRSTVNLTVLKIINFIRFDRWR